MAQSFEREASEVADSLSVFVPRSKNKPSNENENLTIIPDVVGMGAKDAVHMMKKRGLDVKLEGCGTVKCQSVSAGSEVNNQETIILYLE
jgi:beta-lactam-binding protein with PASTA domain